MAPWADNIANFTEYKEFMRLEKYHSWNLFIAKGYEKH
jgi:hypothetical protein